MPDGEFGKFATCAFFRRTIHAMDWGCSVGSRLWRLLGPFVFVALISEGISRWLSHGRGLSWLILVYANKALITFLVCPIVN
jgi:hypothetical protein